MAPNARFSQDARRRNSLRKFVYRTTCESSENCNPYQSVAHHLGRPPSARSISIYSIESEKEEYTNEQMRDSEIRDLPSHDCDFMVPPFRRSFAQAQESPLAREISVRRRPVISKIGSKRFTSRGERSVNAPDTSLRRSSQRRTEDFEPSIHRFESVSEETWQDEDEMAKMDIGLNLMNNLSQSQSSDLSDSAGSVASDDSYIPALELALDDEDYLDVPAVNPALSPPLNANGVQTPVKGLATQLRHASMASPREQKVHSRPASLPTGSAQLAGRRGARISSLPYPNRQSMLPVPIIRPFRKILEDIPVHYDSIEKRLAEDTSNFQILPPSEEELYIRIDRRRFGASFSPPG